MSSRRATSFLAAVAVHCALACPADAGEGGAILLDLETALRGAAANLTIQQAALLPLAGRQRVREEQGRFDPVLEISRVRSQDADAQPLDPFGSRPPASEVLIDDHEGSLRGLLPTGASYRAGISSRNLRGTFNSFADDYYAFLGVSITQPLLRNSGTDAALAPLRLARTEDESAKWQYRQVVHDTLTFTALAYYDLLRARETLRVAERSVAMVDQLVRDNERRYERGAMSSQDVIEARARAARRKDSLFGTRLAVSDAENRLKRLVYADFASVAGQRIEPRPLRGETPPAGALKEAASAALDSRPDYQQARITVEQRRIQAGLERNRAMPAVDLVASYGYNGNDSSLGDSISRAREGEAESFSVGAVFSLPLPNRTADARRRIALLELQRAELALEDFSQEISRQIADALQAIAVAEDRVRLTRETRALAAQSLEAEEKRLRAGTSTTFLVLEQQENLADAELREADALAVLAGAVAGFFRLTGRTLQGFGLESSLGDPAPTR